jgi:hypothetical protein
MPALSDLTASTDAKSLRTPSPKGSTAPMLVPPTSAEAPPPGDSTALTILVPSQPSPPPPPPPPPGDPGPGTILVPAGNALHSGLASDIGRGHLVVAPDNHLLMHVDGTPFVYLADTAWRLTGVSREGIDLYLEDRRAKGFTVIQMGVSIFFGAVGDPNFYGNKTSPS